MRHAVVRIRGQRAHHVNQIGDHGRGRGLGARASTVKHSRPHGVALDQHGIHRPIPLGDESAFRNQRRMHAQFYPAVGAAGNAQQLQTIAQFFRVLHVHAR